MGQEVDEVFSWNDRIYVPFHTARLAAGPFLPVSPDWVDRYLVLPPALYHGVRDRYVDGIRMPRTRLAAAQVHGDSMICRDVFHGDIVLFQRVAKGQSGRGKIVVIEKVGEEEGLGAWALKKLVIERGRLSRQNEYQDETDWDDPVVVLRSYNPRIGPARLDPDGRYRVHGVFLRSLRAHDANFVDSDVIRRRVAGEP
jgi:hypothetical protein